MERHLTGLGRRGRLKLETYLNIFVWAKRKILKIMLLYFFVSIQWAWQFFLVLGSNLLLKKAFKSTGILNNFQMNHVVFYVRKYIGTKKVDFLHRFYY